MWALKKLEAPTMILSINIMKETETVLLGDARVWLKSSFIHHNRHPTILRNECETTQSGRLDKRHGLLLI